MKKLRALIFIIAIFAVGCQPAAVARENFGDPLDDLVDNVAADFEQTYGGITGNVVAEPNSESATKGDACAQLDLTAEEYANCGEHSYRISKCEVIEEVDRSCACGDLAHGQAEEWTHTFFEDFVLADNDVGVISSDYHEVLQKINTNSYYVELVDDATGFMIQQTTVFTLTGFTFTFRYDDEYGYCSDLYEYIIVE